MSIWKVTDEKLSIYDISERKNENQNTLKNCKSWMLEQPHTLILKWIEVKLRLLRITGSKFDCMPLLIQQSKIKCKLPNILSTYKWIS